MLALQIWFLFKYGWHDGQLVGVGLFWTMCTLVLKLLRGWLIFLTQSCEEEARAARPSPAPAPSSRPSFPLPRPHPHPHASPDPNPGTHPHPNPHPPPHPPPHPTLKPSSGPSPSPWPRTLAPPPAAHPGAPPSASLPPQARVPFFKNLKLEDLVSLPCFVLHSILLLVLIAWLDHAAFFHQVPDGGQGLGLGEG